MVNQLVRIGLALLMTTALAGPTAAWAQAEEEEELGEDDDPCAGVEPACGDSSDDEGDGEGGGGKLASRKSKASGGGSGGGEGEGAGSGEGEGEGAGEGEGEGEGGGDGEGEGDSEGEDEGDSESESSATAGADATVEGAPMQPTLGEGNLSIWTAVQVGLNDGSTGDPLSFEPDVWLGINDKLTAGVVTSIHATSGFWGGAGQGVCVGDLCGKAFDNVGAEALYALKADSSLVFALDLGFHAEAFDPVTLSGKVGAKGIWRSGKLSVGFAPNVFIGITERGAGNKELLNLPVDLSFGLSESLFVGVQSGISTPFEALGDNYVVPVALGALFMISPKLTATAAFSLDRVTSGAGGGATDARSLSFALGYLM